MHLDPKGEDILELIPHVSSVAAAYGDPTGKYAGFLKRTMATYQTRPFWFNDQTMALPNSPAARMNTRSKREPDVDSTISFECPTVFATVSEVELESGLFVTCKQLKPFYLTDSPPVDNL